MREYDPSARRYCTGSAAVNPKQLKQKLSLLVEFYDDGTVMRENPDNFV
jgi:hypothetical protein